MASIKSYPRAWAGGASGKVWKVSWREGGEQRSKTVYTFKHAKEVKAQIEAAQAEGRRVDPIKGRIRCEDFIDQDGEEWMADLSAKARGNYEHTLRTLLLPFFGSKRLNQLGRHAIADWVSKVRSAWSPWTIKEAFVTLRSSLGYAVKSGRLDSNPVAGCGDLLPKLPKRRQKVLLTPGVVLLLANAVKLGTGRSFS